MLRRIKGVAPRDRKRSEDIREELGVIAIKKQVRQIRMK